MCWRHGAPILICVEMIVVFFLIQSENLLALS